MHIIDILSLAGMNRFTLRRLNHGNHELEAYTPETFTLLKYLITTLPKLEKCKY